MSLVTLADVRTYVGVPDNSQDALLTIFQDSVEQQIIDYCDVSFTVNTVVNEIHDGNRSDIITPRQIPIISIEQIVFNCETDGTLGTVLDILQYYFDKNAITLRGTITPFYRGNVRLDYTAGYATVPAPVKLAIYMAVKANYQRKKNNREGIASRRKQDEAETYNGAWDQATGLPLDVLSMLQPYKVYEFPNLSQAQRNY